MEIIDHIIVLLIFLHAVYGFITYPKVKKSLIVGNTEVKIKLFKETIFWLWFLTLFLLIAWYSQKRLFTEIGFSYKIETQFLILLIFVFAVGAYFISACYRVYQDIEYRQSLVGKMGEVTEILPKNKKELRIFILMSITAGVCEEILYRGFIIWYLSNLVEYTYAVIISIIIFGLAHGYQGWKGLIQATIIGGIFTLLYVFSSSLWLSIILHATVDIYAGVLGWLVLGKSNNHRDKTKLIEFRG